MKRYFFFLMLVVASGTLWGFDNSNKYSVDKGEGSDYKVFGIVTAWSSATESTRFLIYYKEGNGVRTYYSSCDDTPSDVCRIHVRRNKYYNCSACDDFRRNYQYTIDYHRYFFNCDLPLFTEAEQDEYTFFACVKGWSDPVESSILFIYYKEGNGVRRYYSSCGDNPDNKTCGLTVERNKLFRSKKCNDYRKNYRYTAHGYYYFNYKLPFYKLPFFPE